MKYSPQLIADCERFIKESKLNYTVQELLEKTVLDVSYNQHITFIPNLPNVEWVFCYNCPLLTSLPNWENVERVSCSNCPLLTSLPNWVKVVHCYDCPKLDLTKNDMNENCLVRYWENGAMIPFATLLSFLKGEMQALDILRISNVEIRRTLLGFYPTDKLVKELKPVLIEESEMGNRMYLLDLDGIQAKILMYKCPSSDREYTKFIEDHWTCADSAMAFHHGYESVTAYRLDKMQT